MIWSHCVKSYGYTPETSALSSGESKFYGIVGAAASKGIVEDVAACVEIQVYTGSSAAKSIASRRGAGKIRPFEVHHLWIQGRVAKRELVI